MKFIVWCWDYSKFIGGVRVMHKLCHLLNSLGGDAYVTAKVTNPDWNTPVYDGNGFDKEQTVVIYPECISDNLLDAKHVVRWILFHQTAHYTETDYVFKLCEKYYTHGDKCDGMLEISDFSLDKWKDFNIPREFNMLLYRKGAWKQPFVNPNLKKPFDDLNFDNIIIYDEIEKEQDEYFIADCFNKCQTFISYDECSFISCQAALCGCDSIVIPHPDLSADEWRKIYNGFLYGVAYGFEQKELDYARETRHLVRSHLQGINDKSVQSCQNFLDFWTNIIN